jgi:hypothetical protein
MNCNQIKQKVQIALRPVIGRRREAAAHAHKAAWRCSQYQWPVASITLHYAKKQKVVC